MSMSILQGVSDDGAIKAIQVDPDDVSAVDHYYRGLPFSSDGSVLITFDAGSSPYYYYGFKLSSIGAIVCSMDEIAYYSNATPFDATDNMVVDSFDVGVSHYHQSIPFTASGAVAVYSVEAPTDYILSLLFDCENRITPLIGQNGTFNRPSTATYKAVCDQDLLISATQFDSNDHTENIKMLKMPVGTIRTAGIDEPRIEANGLLIEGESTNYVLYSTDLTGSGWLGANSTVNSDALISPTGDQDSDIVSYIGFWATRYVRVTSLKPDTQYIATVYICKLLDITLEETSVVLQAYSDVQVDKKNYLDGVLNSMEIGEWKRISLEFTTNSNPSLVTLNLRSDVVSGYELGIWQVEVTELPFFKSPIITQGTPITRSRDILTYPVPVDFNPYEFTIDIEFSVATETIQQQLIDVGGVVTLTINVGGTITGLFSNQLLTTTGTVKDVSKVNFSLSGGVLTLTLDGQSVALETQFTNPFSLGTKITVGNVFYGNIKSLKIGNNGLPRALTRPELSQLVADGTDLTNANVSEITSFYSLFVNKTPVGDISGWDVSSGTNFSSMFQGSQFNGDISGWDVSSGTNFSSMFQSSKFNQDISGWDVSSSASFRSMFQSSQFNGDISGWDVSSSKDFGYMFAFSQFNGDISGWDVSSATDLNNMFRSSPFSGDVSNWNVSSCTYFTGMFESSQFNGDVSNWNVSSGTSFSGMFKGTKFNGDISNWNVSSGTYFTNMFSGSQFNGDISGWDVSLSKSFYYMFSGSQFNGDISGWDVSSSTDFSYMFNNSKFNGDVSNWNVSSGTKFVAMFNGSPFNQDISNWNVSSCTDFGYMFAFSQFNGDISGWDVSLSKSFRNMFSGSQFNGDISGWNVSLSTNFNNMFQRSQFNQDISGWDTVSAQTWLYFKGESPLIDEFTPPLFLTPSP